MTVPREVPSVEYNPARAPDYVPIPLLRRLQLERLQSVVRRAYDKVPPFRLGVFGAEPWSESMRRHFESHTRIKACDVYGLSEITGPDVASECAFQCGLHVFEDHFYRRSSTRPPVRGSPTGRRANWC